MPRRRPCARGGRGRAVADRGRGRRDGRDARRARRAAGARAGRVRAPARGAGLGAGRRDGRPPERRRDPARSSAARRASGFEPRFRRAHRRGRRVPAVARRPRRHGDDGRRRGPAGGARPLACADHGSLRHTATLAEAPARFGPQKGASPDEIRELEERFRGRPCGELPGSGAAGGLGAALASPAPSSWREPRYLFELTGFRERVARADLVVTGEGAVDGRPSRAKPRARHCVSARSSACAASSSAGAWTRGWMRSRSAATRRGRERISRS